MAPRKHVVAQAQGPSKAEPARTIPGRKTASVGSADLIRILRPSATGIFRDGTTVGSFLAGVESHRAGLVVLFRAHRDGSIAFQEPGHVAADVVPAP